MFQFCSQYEITQSHRRPSILVCGPAAPSTSGRIGTASINVQVQRHSLRSHWRKDTREGLWCIGQFGQQLDAMIAWDRFKGRCLLGEEFSYLERPEKEVGRPELERETA
jgi:hypothetical protein